MFVVVVHQDGVVDVAGNSHVGWTCYDIVVIHNFSFFEFQLYYIISEGQMSMTFGNQLSGDNAKSAKH
jgi:hypothetical protein